GPVEQRLGAGVVQPLVELPADAAITVAATPVAEGEQPVAQPGKPRRAILQLPEEGPRAVGRLALAKGGSDQQQPSSVQLRRLERAERLHLDRAAAVAQGCRGLQGEVLRGTGLACM